MTLDRRIAVLALATFASGTEAYVYAGLLSDVAAELSVDVGRAGLLATGFAVTYAVLAPLLASLTGALPRRQVLTLGLVALGLVNLAAAAAPTFAWLLVSRIACGAIAALVGPSATAAASALVTPDRRGRAMALVSAGMALAFTLGVPLGSAIGGAFGWRATFVFAGALLLLCAAAIRLLVPRVPVTDASGLGTLWIGLDPAVLPRLVLTALVFTATFSSVAYLGPVANAVVGARGFGVGLFQACIGLGSILGIVLGGRLSDRPDALRHLPTLLAVIVCTQLGYVGAQSLSLVVPIASALLAFSILFGAAALFATMPIVQVGLITAAPGHRNLVLALNGSMVFLGQGLGAALGSLIIGAGQLAHTGFAGSALAAALAGVILFQQRRSIKAVTSSA
jgi:DHA1 family inner membrane transport protein